MKKYFLLTFLLTTSLSQALECKVPKPFRQIDEKNTSIFHTKFLLKDNHNHSEKGLYVGPQPHMINLWASWCEPCRRELPYLQKINAQNRAKVHLMNVEDDAMDAEKVLADVNVSLKTRYTKMELLDELGINGLPTSVLFHEDKIYLGVGVLKGEVQINNWLICLNKKNNK